MKVNQGWWSMCQPVILARGRSVRESPKARKSQKKASEIRAHAYFAIKMVSLGN
jgi:hypothetical protein